MVDWTSSMQQTFEYYIVDPGTWQDIAKINNVKSCTIKRDYKSSTLGSATIETEEDLYECYIREYLVTTQNGITEKHPLGTHLVQTPSTNYDGKTNITSMEAYSPLIELKEKMPPIGYSIPKKIGDNEVNIMNYVYELTRENLRAPVVKPYSDKNLYDDFVANTNDSWLTFNEDFMANAEFIYELDEMGRVLFGKNESVDGLQPVWTYSDDNASILYPDISLDHDLYGVPNVVEILYSSDNRLFYGKAVNDDPTSPTSTAVRGREIVYRVTDLSLPGVPTEGGDIFIQQYAEEMLKKMSTLEYTISYKHGYCPVRIGDCVRINLTMPNGKKIDSKAKVITQSISCTPGCPVSETAVYTTKLWR